MIGSRMWYLVFIPGAFWIGLGMWYLVKYRNPKFGQGTLSIGPRRLEHMDLVPLPLTVLFALAILLLMVRSVFGPPFEK